MIGYSYHREYYDFTILDVAVQILSIMYWSKPTYNWKRTLDIYLVYFTVLYHCVRAYHAEYNILFYICTIVGMLCYSLSWIYYNQNKLWLSVYAHASIHVIFNIGIMSLYFGKIY